MGFDIGQERDLSTTRSAIPSQEPLDWVDGGKNAPDCGAEDVCEVDLRSGEKTMKTAEQVLERIIESIL
jgi:hypothetical protein